MCPPSSRQQPTTSVVPSTTTHWCNLVHFSVLTSSQQHQIVHLNHLHEPTSYKEAASFSHWVQAMQAEIHALQANNTWIEVDLPPDKRAISSKWVYKIKLKVDGSLERYKVRLVIWGNTQKEGIDSLKHSFQWLR